MMTGMRSALLVTMAGFAPWQLSAQTPETRPDASTIVAAISDLGYVGGWGSYADFDGCPQNDPVGADVLDLISATTQTPSVITSLIHFWADEYETCGYAPLDAWFGVALTQLADQESGQLDIALSGLPATLKPDLVAQMQSLVADPSRPASVRTALGSAVLGSLAPTDRMSAYFQMLSTPGLPAEWVAAWSGDLLQALGAAYVTGLSNAAPSLDAETLRAAIGTVMTGVTVGAVSSADPSLLVLSQSLDGRPELAGSRDFIESMIVGTAFQGTTDYIQQLVDDGRLDEEHRTGLESVLEQAWNAYTVDRPSAAPLFGAFVADVEGLVSGGQMTQADAQPLIDAGEAVIAALNSL